MLPSKFETHGARTQNLPKRDLGRRHHTPQPARSRDRPAFRFRRNVSQHLPSPSTMRTEEHTSELQSLMRISYAVFCLQKKKITTHHTHISHTLIHTRQLTT